MCGYVISVMNKRKLIDWWASSTGVANQPSPSPIQNE